MGVDPERQKATMAEMDKVASKFIGEAKVSGEDPKCIFFAARTSDGPVPKVRSMCSLEQRDQKMDMILLDLDDNGAFYKAGDVEITADSIEAFIKGYTDKKLERHQLKQG